MACFPKLAPMSQTITLVIGANRGIGFEIAKQCAERGRRVIATYRGDAGKLASLDIETISGVDICSDDSVASLVSAIEEKTDVLSEVFVVAGVLSRETLDELNFDDVEKQFRVNSMGPLRAVAALQSLLSEGSKVGILTSRMGSIADNGSGGMYGYRMSKAAVNAAGMSLAQDLKKRGVSVVLLHPGFVRTDMTQGAGHIDADESARGLIDRMDELTLETTGQFRHANGEELPW